MSTEETLEALDFIEENDVRFLRLQFTDLLGQNRNIAISPYQFERAINTGFPFRTSCFPGLSASGQQDLLLRPIVSTIKLLPWRPQQGSVAKMVCEVCYPDGEPLESDPRRILKRVIEQARRMGIQFEVGVKIEFSLFELDEAGRPTRKPADHAGFFDLAPLDTGENVRREIILTLEDMGFSIESSHHEAGPGQHEIDFTSADPLTCADNIQTFKTVVKTVARQNGLHASFMPKPMNGEPGNGMHVMISMLENMQDAFGERGGLISKTGENFCAGLMRRMPEIIAVTNPTVNSYKRLAGGFIAPHDLAWRPEAMDSLIRVPRLPSEQTRVIVRNPDPSCNPYTAFALMIAAGLEGIEEELSPEDYQIEALPKTLETAVERLRQSELGERILGWLTRETYCREKQKEWEDYLGTVHDWEISKYFETI